MCILIGRTAGDCVNISPEFRSIQRVRMANYTGIQSEQVPVVIYNASVVNRAQIIYMYISK